MTARAMEVAAVSSLRTRLGSVRFSPTRSAWCVVGCWALLVAGSFVQQPGKTTFDTKLDLTVDPVRFLGRSLQLWNPLSSLGELQNQAYGYLWPQGPFFVVGHVAQLPDWVTQRAWCALLLVLAFEGTRRLAIALRMVPSGAAVLAGLAYALAPRILSEVGTLSGEVVPSVVLPWMVIPLVLAQRGRIEPRAAALLSGLAFVCAGGLNATEDLAILPLPLLVICLGPGRGVRRRLVGWWAGAVVLASLWWVLPLLVLGRYSPPFLNYIERASTTTGSLDWANLFRGADQWLMFYTLGGRGWWPAGFALATEPALVMATAVVSAAGLVGVFLARGPWRIPLGLSVILGLACMYAGHSGQLGSPIALPVQHLLDGPLAAFRNVHKVDPLVRLPLALGFGWLMARLAQSVRVHRVRRVRVEWVLPTLCVVVSVSALAVTAWPILGGSLRTPGWSRIPPAWHQAARYLAAHQDGTRTLVVPGSGFAEQTWGATQEEPMQGLARTPWVTRGQVPLAPGQTVRFLDALEVRISDGLGSPALAADLARSGIRYLLVRSDLDLAETDAPSPLLVNAAVEHSPGLRLVAHFGRGAGPSGSEVAIFRVQRAVPVVEASTVSSVVGLAGAPDDVITALETSVLKPSQPVVLQGDLGPLSPPVSLVGDAYRRVDREFGRVHQATSGPMAREDLFHTGAPPHDYPSAPDQRRAFLRSPDAVAADASTSEGFANTLGPVRPDRGPWAAFDGSPDTGWLSAPFSVPAKQWVQLTLRNPMPVTTVRVLTDRDPSEAEPVRSLTITAGATSLVAPVNPATGTAQATFDGSDVTALRVAVRAAAHPEGQVGLREITFPGFDATQSLVIPPTAQRVGVSLLFRADPGVRACSATFVGPICDPGRLRPPEASVALDRTFTLGARGRFRIGGTVVARSTRGTAQLLEPLGSAVRVVASSVLDDDPSVSGQFAYDADPTTAWVAAQNDAHPSLTLTWARPRTLSRLQVSTPIGDVEPARALISSGQARRTVRLAAGGLGYFQPLTTRHLTITFGTTGHGSTLSPGQSIAVSALHLAGLDALQYQPPRGATTGAACGLGPSVTLDTVTYATRVVGNLGEVIDGEPLAWELCAGPVPLGVGVHHLRVEPTGQFAAVDAVLRGGGTGTATDSTRWTRIRSWGDERREVEVGPGPRAVLRIAENQNAGWRASLDGRPLPSTVVDGWQQAWVVPAGHGGLVTVDFAPNGTYQKALALGAVGVLVLLVAALVALCRGRGRMSPVPEFEEARRSEKKSGGTRWVLLGGTVALAGLVGGPVLAVGVVAVELARFRGVSGAVVGSVAGVLLVVSGVLSVTAGHLTQTEPGLLANLVAALGVGALLALIVEEL